MSKTTNSSLPPNCAVCRVPFVGTLGAVARLFRIRRHARSPHVCTRCNGHLEEGRLREMTVLFADLAGFTEMTADIGATRAHEVVDEFLRAASEILGAHGGFIDKFIGDAVMAIFNVPVPTEDHAARAVAAAAELHRALPALSEKIGMDLHVAIGIASGVARVGRLGSDQIRDYSVIGDVVNIAARIESAARAGETLVTKDVYRTVADPAVPVPPEALKLKGFRDPIIAHRLGATVPAPITAVPDQHAPPIGIGALIFAILGSGCGATGLAAWITAGMSGAAAASVMAAVKAFDASPLRLPFLGLSVLLAAVAIAAVWRARSTRAQTCLDGRFSCMTALDRRRLMMAGAFAVVVLLLVAFELVTHHSHNGRF